MKKTMLLGFLLCLLPVFSAADVILFRDGTKLECEVKEVRDGQAGVRESGKEYYIPMEKISELFHVEKIKEDDTMTWRIAGSAILMSLLA
ncbi:MAG TPA: hypothetical protein P5511_04705, partial [Candidatus Goldiibacteriota bacterium]|nr:hypothetical protein [Candidatus Goldiibacteriota bacterium]